MVPLPPTTTVTIFAEASRAEHSYEHRSCQSSNSETGTRGEAHNDSKNRNRSRKRTHDGNFLLEGGGMFSAAQTSPYESHKGGEKKQRTVEGYNPRTA